MNRNARSALHQRRRNIDRRAKSTQAVEFFNVLTSPQWLDTMEAQLPEHRQETEDAAVHHRGVIDEQQIRQPQRFGPLIVDRQIVVRVRYRPRP